MEISTAFKRCDALEDKGKEESNNVVLTRREAIEILQELDGLKRRIQAKVKA